MLCLPVPSGSFKRRNTLPTLPITNTWLEGEDSIDKRYWSAPSPSLQNTILIKRALVRAEWSELEPVEIMNSRKTLERLQNEVDAIEYVKKRTTIPVPNVVCAFEDRDSYYVLQEKVQGATLATNVPQEHMHIVTSQIEAFIDQLQALKSHCFGGIGGLVCLPVRFTRKDPRMASTLRFIHTTYDSEPFVFCHGDLNANNILVDPVTYKVVCVLDWEHAGFYPPELEGRWWMRPGPSYPIDGENKGEASLHKLLLRLATPASMRKVQQHPGIPRQVLKRRAIEKSRRSIPQKPYYLATFEDPEHPWRDLDQGILHAHRCLAALAHNTPVPSTIFVDGVSGRIDPAKSSMPSTAIDYFALGEHEAKARSQQAWDQLGEALWAIIFAAYDQYPGIRECVHRLVAANPPITDTNLSDLCSPTPPDSDESPTDSSNLKAASTPPDPPFISGSPGAPPDSPVLAPSIGSRREQTLKTVAEPPFESPVTGDFATRPTMVETGQIGSTEPDKSGPSSGQLVRRAPGGNIVELRAFGGEGLKGKPLKTGRLANGRARRDRPRRRGVEERDQRVDAESEGEAFSWLSSTPLVTIWRSLLDSAPRQSLRRQVDFPPAEPPSAELRRRQASTGTYEA